MRTKIGIGCLSALAVCAWVAQAQEMSYVTLTEGDAKGSNSFANPGHWSDGLAPHDDADYLVALGDQIALRTPANSATSLTFGGRSLTIGELDGEDGFILQKAGKTAVMTYPDLRLVKGSYSQGSEYGAYPIVSSIDGTFTILSPKTQPFNFIGSNNRAFDIRAELIGSAETALRFAGAPNELSGTILFILNGSSPDYYGSFIVDDVRASLAVGSEEGHPMGAPAEAFEPQAVILRNNGAIRLLAETPPAIDPNKGVWVDASGGRLYADSGVTGTSTYTFTGDGVLERDGTGKIILAGSLSCAGFRLTKGEVEIADACQLAEGCPILFAVDPATAPADYPLITGSGEKLSALALTLPENVSVSGPTPQQSITLRDTTFAGGGVCSKIDLTTGENTVVTLDDSCTVTWPLPIRLDHHYPAYNGPNRYKVLMVSKTMKVVTAEDFIDQTAGAEYGLPKTEIVVEEDETGLQAVYIRRLEQVIEMIATGGGDANVASAASMWSDNLGAHANADYLIFADVARSMRTGKVATEYTFPGRSLTLLGTSKSNSANIIDKADNCTFSDLRMYAYSKFGASRDGDYSILNVYGKIGIFGTREKGAVYLTSERNRSLDIYAELYGDDDALIICEPSTSNNGVRHHNLYGTNTNYYGSFELSQNGYGTPGLAKYQEISIEDEINLGGNPHTFNYRALNLAYYSCLVARKSLTIDDPNRGILINVYGQFRIDEGVMRVTSPIALNGTLRKLGNGLLELGSPITFGATGSDTEPTAGKNNLFIEGSVKPLTGSVFSGLSVTFSNEAAVVVAPLEGDDLLREKGVVNLNETPYALFGEENGGFTVRLEYPAAARRGNFQVPLLTVCAEAAEQLREWITLDAAMQNYQVTLAKKEVEEGVQFYADFRDLGGTLIFVQ